MPDLDLPHRFGAVRDRTEALAAPLSAEDQTVQSMPDVSPTKWHRAHTSWFFEEFILQPHVAGDRVFHPRYSYLFNSYYEAVGPRHPRNHRGNITRPGIDDIARYRADVDDRMGSLLAGSQHADVEALVVLGLHHEEQHQELLLMDIKHVLSNGSVDCAYARYKPRPDWTAPPMRWVPHNGGIVEIGDGGGSGFAFDNERPRHEVLLRPFEMGSRLVTNGDWLEFVADGGYERADLWLSDGWHAVQGGAWDAPLYWMSDGGGWCEHRLTGVRPVDPAEPVVHVSYYEADAFARWSGARLPTEAEWEVVAADEPVPTVGAFLDLDVLHPRPATGDEGLEQLYGELWQWTSSAYLPYPGFRPEAGAVGEYNGKFMVNQHVLRGGACVTPAGHLRTTYRNFFPPSARWAFSGVRLARDV